MVIVVLGILAVTAGPKLLGEKDFAHHTVRDQLISEFRLAQLRALNDRSHCYQVRIDSNDFGIFQADLDGGGCDDTYTQLTTTELVHEVQVVELFTSSADETLSISFDSKGRHNGGNCTAGNDCLLAVVANKPAYLCLKSEGFIHAC